MKTFIVSILLLLVLNSCSDKHDALYVAAANPVFGFSRDTISIREKDPNNINNTGNGKLTLFSGNVSQQLNLQYADTSNKVQVRFNGDIVQAGQPILVSDSTKLFLTCNTPGLYALDFVLTDQLGKTTTKTLIVKCLANSKPVADFYTAFIESQSQSWVYRFNGGLCADTDGTILSFHYLIDGMAVTNNTAFIDYTFHSVGNHDISLYVTDDLNKNSDTVHRYITIR